MRKFLPFLLVLTIFSLSFLALAPASASPVEPAPARSTAYELLDAVNALRASHGLYAYQANSILMSIAQAQAEYNLAIQTITHTGPGGTRPFQRALNAGYLVAGDLSQGGFFSENITAGVGQTADEAVQVWMGDAPHQNTMLSGTLQDAGAGVASSGNTYYYVLDAGLSTGGTPVAYTPVGVAQSTPTIVPNTPNPDGSIIHIVQKGDTLGSISMAYGVKLADLLKLNNLTLTSVIYENQKIIISKGFTPTPTEPTGTPTLFPTMTSWPTGTSTSTMVISAPTFTAIPSANLPKGSATGVVSIIVISAVVIAGVVSLLGTRKKGSG